MSRSFKKSPVSGWTCKESEKFDKQKYNRRLRKKNRTELKKGSEIFSNKKEIIDIWNMSKDGKHDFRFDGIRGVKPSFPDFVNTYKAWMK